MKNRTIESAAAILGIASVLFVASTTIMTNMPKVLSNDRRIYIHSFWRQRSSTRQIRMQKAQ